MSISPLMLSVTSVSALFLVVASACDVPDVEDESIEAAVAEAEAELELAAEEPDPAEDAGAPTVAASPGAALRWDRDARVPMMGRRDANGVAMIFDDQMIDIQAAVPEFAGLWMNEEEEVLDVFMRASDDLKLWTVEQEIRRNFGEDLIPRNGLRAVEVKYNFRELKALQNLFVEHQTGPDDVVMADVDEKRNLVVIGVKTAEAMARIQAFGREIGAEGAFVVEYREPIRFTYLLTDTIRPTGGGLRITLSLGGCSIGFHAKRNGVKGFITASHCSTTMWGTDSTQYRQANANSGVIGSESYDRPGFTGGACPAGRTCRMSDANFSTFSDASAHTFEGSTTPRPVAWPVNTNTTTFAGWGFVQTQANAVGGATVQKVGATSGRTKGKVLSTCFATYPSSSQVILCSHAADYYSWKGDSGGAVFRNTSGTDTTPNLAAHGITYGVEGTGSPSYFSPIGSINSDLGTTALPG